MKVRVYTDYSPIRILNGINKDPSDELASKVGLVGTFFEVEHTDIPPNRINRDCWKVEKGKVIEDPIKISEKQLKISEKLSKKSSILSKLKISEQEFADLFK